MNNLDGKTVRDFGIEWERFDQSELDDNESTNLFENYFSDFPWKSLPKNAVGFDLGCGSGRWARFVAPRVGHLHCIDPSDAIEIARRNLETCSNVTLHRAGVGKLPLAPSSMDFGYSLGVLHHIPNTEKGLRSCVDALKPGAPFLLYLYYSFDNRPKWYQALWKASDLLRRGISRLPSRPKHIVADTFATGIYWPLARTAKQLEQRGIGVNSFPLAAYRNVSFYTMRTDALDRFGTTVESRFSAEQIKEMMIRSGLTNVTMSSTEPFWCAMGYKRVPG